MKIQNTKFAQFFNRNALMLFLTLAFFLRLAYIFTLQDKWYFYDTIHYDTAARAILEGDGFGKSLHFYGEYDKYCLEPVYPLFLAAVYGVFGHSLLAVRIIQSLISVLMIFVAFRLGSLISRRTAWLALAFASIYPFFIYISGLLYVTQLAALIFLFTVYSFFRYKQENSLKWLLLASFSFGLGVVTKPVLAPSGALFALWILIFHRSRLINRFGHVAIFAIISALCLVPWTIRNYVVFHKFATGRVCMGEVRALEYQKHLIDRKVLSEKDAFEVRQFRVKLDTLGGTTLITGYRDDEPFLQYRLIDAIPDFSQGYCGLNIYGGKSAEIVALRFWRQQGDHLLSVLDTSLDSINVAGNGVTISRNSVAVAETDPGWGHKAFLPDITDVVQFEIEYAPDIDPNIARRFAVMIGLHGKPGDEEGYMIWLQPWMDIDIWKIEHGTPQYSLPTIKQYLGSAQLSIIDLVMQYPGMFILNHYIPEFLRFWSPFVSRITTNVNRPGKIQTILSPLFFIPILILLPFGLFRLFRSDLSGVLLLLIPILTVSMVYALFFAEIRYRLPLDAMLIVIAMAGLDFIVSKVEKKNNG